MYKVFLLFFIKFDHTFILIKKSGIEIVKTTLKIPNNIVKELKHISIDDNKTLTEIIVEALVYYLEEKRGKNSTTRNDTFNTLFFL